MHDSWDLVLHSDRSFSEGVQLYEFKYESMKLNSNHNEFLIGWHPKNDSHESDYFCKFSNKILLI